MNMANSVVAVFNTAEQAEQAIKELQRAGVDMNSLSIAAKNTHTDEQLNGYFTERDRNRYWANVRALLGGFWGSLFGSAAFVIPGIGQTLVAGPLVGWIFAGLEGAGNVRGVSPVGAALGNLGIPRESVLKYDAALKADKFLLVAHGTPVTVAKAKQILAGTEHNSYTVYGELALV